MTDTERMLLALLREKAADEQRRAHQRTLRFLAGIAERTGVPMDDLAINAETGEIVDTRTVPDPHAPDA